MDGFKRKIVRYKDDPRLDQKEAFGYNQWHSSFASEKAVRRGSEGLQSSEGSKGFAEDCKASKKRIFDPNSNFVQQWNKIFLLSCLVALFVDPLFFFSPEISNAGCIKIQWRLEVVVTVLRTITDTFYLLHMALQFRTAYVAPSSRVFGRGVLVDDPKLIAERYLRKHFWLDLIAVLPIPQVVIWIIVPALSAPKPYRTKNALGYIVSFQYLPRLYLIFQLTSQIVKSTGAVTETAWAGAAYNLLLYILASHLIGAVWYLFAIERKDTCWRQKCRLENNTYPCDYKYLYCSNLPDPDRLAWHNNTQVYTLCDNSTVFNLGIYQTAYDKSIVSANFVNKYLYCLWFGLQQLSSLGQNLSTSTFTLEVVFAIFIATVGLVLFALLIGNMQTYLQSLGVRLEEWRVKQSDTEEWMQHRQLPQELRDRVRRYNQYKWVATRGVDEEALFKSLPSDLRRDIKRHLCLDLVKKVPLFNEMDGRLLDAICERLKPILRTKHTVIMREGDPVNEMFFIIRGVLDSQTTNGGRTGFFNQIKLGPGSFCGEELLTWVLNPKPSMHLPTSTRLIQAEEEVEAFALTAEDLKFVAKQFRRLHSKQLQHTFRFYSHQWKTWAACFIQASWKRYKKRKSLAKLYSMERNSMYGAMDYANGDSNASLGATNFSSHFTKNSMRGRHKLREVNILTTDEQFLQVPKPEEPDFDADGEEQG